MEQVEVKDEAASCSSPGPVLRARQEPAAGEAVSCSSPGPIQMARQDQATAQLGRAIRHGHLKRVTAILNQFPEIMEAFQPLKFVISEGVTHNDVIKMLVCHTARESLDAILKFCLEQCSENLTVMSHLLKGGAQCTSPILISLFFKRHIRNEPLKHEFIATVLDSTQSELVLGCLLNALVLRSVLAHHQLYRPLVKDIIPVVKRLVAVGCSPWALFDRRLKKRWIISPWYFSSGNDRRKNILPFPHIFAQLIVTTNDPNILAKYSTAIKRVVTAWDNRDKYCEHSAYSAKLAYLIFYASGAWCYPSIQLPAHKDLWKAIRNVGNGIHKLQMPTGTPPWELHDNRIRDLKEICRDSFRQAACTAPNIAYVLEQIPYPSTLKRFILYLDMVACLGFHT